MTRYFMRDTQLAGLEADMMLTPFFSRRYSGVMILSRFHYDTENTKCIYCTAYHKGKGCTEKKCPWLAERLEAGAVPYNELLTVCFENLQNKRLKARLRHLASGYYGGWFYDKAHQRRFELAKAQRFSGLGDGADFVFRQLAGHRNLLQGEVCHLYRTPGGRCHEILYGVAVFAAALS